MDVKDPPIIRLSMSSLCSGRLTHITHIIKSIIEPLLINLKNMDAEVLIKTASKTDFFGWTAVINH